MADRSHYPLSNTEFFNKIGQNLPFPERKKATYLNWHKLLFDDEREALPAEAFESLRYTPEYDSGLSAARACPATGTDSGILADV